MRCRWCWIAAVVAVASGCANWQTRIDPSGEHVFQRDSVAPQAPVSGPIDPNKMGDAEVAGVNVTPTDQIAHVGSEVYLVASVVGTDGYLQPHRRLEWTVSPGTVGQFKSIEKSDCIDHLLGNNIPHKIVSPTYAVGSTLTFYETLDRNTPDPADDVMITSGQGWVSLVSPIEGDTVVTVAAPEVYAWNVRQKTATIHWIDVNWTFPPSSAAKIGGKQTLTTVLTKRTSPTPSGGWIVRYTVVGGPPAGFAPDGATTVEVVSNSAGVAAVELMQKAGAIGANQINIEVLPPKDMPGAAGKNIVLGRGAVLTTWTTSPVVQPSTGVPAIGPGTTGPLPIGPAGTTAAPKGPNPVPTPGGAGGSVINRSPVEIEISEPPPTQVNGQAKFVINVKNVGTQPLNNLILYEMIGQGLKHPKAPTGNHLEVAIPSIPPGGNYQVAVSFIVTEPGQQLCHTVKVLDANRKELAKKKACVAGVGQPTGAGGQPPIGPAGNTGNAPGNYGDTSGGTNRNPADLAVKISREKATLNEQEKALFWIDVTNTSNKPQTNVKVEVYLDEVYDREQAEASRGFWHDRGGLYNVIKELKPGEKKELKLRATCLKPSSEALAQVVVTSAEGGTARDETSCAILSANNSGGNWPGGLPGNAQGSNIKLSVLCPTNAARVKKQFPCVVTVENIGTVEQRSVAVNVKVPAGLTVVRMGTVGPTNHQIQPLRPGLMDASKLERSEVRFEPLASLAPGKSQTFRVIVQTKTPGSYEFEADVTTWDSFAPQTQKQSVEVVP